jgi:phosphorylcholine metabolism protein LicD
MLARVSGQLVLFLEEGIMIDFLQDEVRSGFYIPTAIKQAWAVQLKILSEIDRICGRYDIKYFADWGTYLGTVRHGGFIPWDDDLDICMMREDYERFKQVAKSELPKGYTIHNFETKENHRLFLARVVNSNSICFDKEHLDENYNFPYIATVDIFILDYLYRDEEKERERCDEVKKIIAQADGIENGSYSAAVTVKLLGELEKKYGLEAGSLWNNSGCKEDFGEKNRHKLWVALYRLAETQMGRTPKEESDNIGQIFPWVLKGSRGLPKEYYENTVRLPFEYTTIPVPAYYHKGLAGRYGDYMRVCKIWNGHDYPYFESQRENLQAVADFKLPEFTFNPGMLRENLPPLDTSGSLKAMARECLTELENMVGDITRSSDIYGSKQSASAENMKAAGVLPDERDKILGRLADCQQLAVDLGTLIEEVKGEKRESTAAVVGSLESFCEAVYGLYTYIQDPLDGRDMIYDEQEQPDGQKLFSVNEIDRLEKLNECMKVVREKLERYVINRREVLFVIVGKNRRKGFESLYEMEAADKDTDVYVVNVPVMRKDAYGQIISGENNFTEAADEDRKKYAPELHMPDVIYIQDGYDGENPCLTIPEKYYAENLQRYTEKLVFVPPFTVDEFGKEDITDWYNMKHYVTVPGVVRADAVLVQSENMRKNYIERLTEFAGEKTGEIWEKKIIAKKASSEIHETGRKKRLMYCLGLNELFEHGEDIKEKLNKRLDTVKSCADKLDVMFCMYPPDKEIWIKACPDISEKIFKKVVDFGGFVSIDVEKLDSCDAYYGSPSPYAHYFNSKGKPVMLCDYSIDN